MINKKVLLKYALWVVSLSVLIGINIYLIQKAFALHTQNVASKKVELFQKVYETRQNLYQQVHSITKNIEQSAHKLSQVGYSNLKKHLKDTAQAIPFISSIGIAFEPYEYNAEEKLFSIYLVKQDGAFTTIDTTQYYNYLNSDWYKQAFITDGAWSKPFTELTTRTSALRFTVPLFRFDTKTNTRIRIGAFFVNISREKLDEFANETIYDPNQYAFILSSEGNLITYPIESYLAEYETLSDVSRLPGKKELHLVSNKIKSMHGGITTYYDSLLHTSFWVAFEPLNISDWFLVYITPKKDIFDIEESRHLILQFSCTLLLLLHRK
jgi:sigma-B regulation protein RsbU (phosphoserine phosphatase)